MKALYKITIIAMASIATMGINCELVGNARGQRCPCNKPPTVLPKPVQPSQENQPEQLQQNDSAPKHSNHRTSRVDRCGCTAAQGSVKPPQPKPLPEQPVENQDEQTPSADQPQSEGDITKRALIKQCCTMITEEAQKIDDPCLAQQLLEMVHMVETEECCRTHNGVSDETMAATLLLRECCMALHNEAKETCNECLMQQAENIMNCVNAIDGEMQPMPMPTMPMPKE